jgi:hypothetical protein
MGATGSDGRFAIFPDLQSGTRALGALLSSYNRRGFNTIDSIVNRYAPGHENNTEAYSNYLAKSMGVKRDQPLGAQHLNSLVGGVSLYESKFNPMDHGVVLQQSNTVTIHGATDPVATGKAVGDSQQRVNADLTRNLRGAIR